MNALKKQYNEEIVPALKEKFNYSSVMEVPRLEKIVINIGVGDGAREDKYIEAAKAELAQITGQAPVVTKAKKSIAGFKLREGQPIGVKVTLRGENMYNFMEKLIRVAVNYDDVVKLRGMDIVFVTTAKTNEEAYALLDSFGMPFRK